MSVVVVMGSGAGGGGSGFCGFLIMLEFIRPGSKLITQTSGSCFMVAVVAIVSMDFLQEVENSTIMHNNLLRVFMIGFFKDLDKCVEQISCFIE